MHLYCKCECVFICHSLNAAIIRGAATYRHNFLYKVCDIINIIIKNVRLVCMCERLLLLRTEAGRIKVDEISNTDYDVE